MARNARIVLPKVAHHVTQRGNNREDVFFTDDDRHAYLDLLRNRCAAAGVDVLGYCLMTNHVHLIVVPPDGEALAHAVGRTHFTYTQYVNRLHGRSGHLWQGRFYSCALDGAHVWTSLAYVERNPVRARLVRRAWRWPWSSAAAHVERATDEAGLLDVKRWRKKRTAARWQKQLLEPVDDQWRERFWRAANTGRPLAEDRWLARWEAKSGLRLRANPVGRPRKAKTTKTIKRRRKKA